MQENFILLRKKLENIRDKNKIGIIQNWWNTADIDDPNDWKAEELSKIFNKKSYLKRNSKKI